MFGTERPILGHVATRLAHEPDRRTIDRFTTAGFEEALIDQFGILETRGRSCQFARGQAPRGCAITEEGLCTQESAMLIPGEKRTVRMAQHPG